jgi:amino acid permease
VTESADFLKITHDDVLIQWLTASVFVMSIALAMAELASSAPTSGGVRQLLFM